jgi:hypothetical protein
VCVCMCVCVCVCVCVQVHSFTHQTIPIDIRAAMRPGCVHLSLDFWFSTPEELQASKAAVQQKFLDATLQMGRGVFWARQDTHVLLPYSQHQVCLHLKTRH